MSAVFRHPDQAAIEVSHARSLAAGAAAVIQWLDVPGNARRVSGWTLDLSFAGRDPTASAGAKESLPFELIERLVANRIQLRLSISPPDGKPTPGN